MVTIGSAPFYECSSRGDKRFSAFYARIKTYNNRTVEDLYQAAKIFEDGRTGLHWKEAKGKRPINVDYCKVWYAHLWDMYIWENPELLSMLKAQPGLSDVFGKEGSCCQALELWRIRNTVKYC